MHTGSIGAPNCHIPIWGGVRWTSKPKLTVWPRLLGWSLLAVTKRVFTCSSGVAVLSLDVWPYQRGGIALAILGLRARVYFRLWTPP